MFFFIKRKTGIIGLCLFFLSCNMSAQKTVQLGFNFNPTYVIPFEFNRSEYYKLNGRMNFSTGFFFSFNLNNKYSITTGLNMTKRSYSIIQEKFDNYATGYINHNPTFHSLQIPFYFSKKVMIKENFYFKHYYGISFDINNFNSYKIKYKLDFTSDTLTSFAKYNFHVFNSASLLAGFKFEKLYSETGSYEFGLFVNYSLNRFPPIEVNTSIGEEINYKYVSKPFMSYIGFDLTYIPVKGNSLKNVISFRKSPVYMIIIQSLIITGIMLK